MIKISVIIPCYNMAETLEESVSSVLNQTYESWEVIIVNDGSTDPIVEEVGKSIELKDERISYYKKQNGGLGDARNFGVEKASGEFILLLDADNNLKAHYMKRVIEVLGDSSSNTSIIYGDAEYIGGKQGLWKMGKFDKLRLLQDNYIDACAVIRKTDVLSIGGFATDLPDQGHEDWDFWLSAIEHGLSFHYLNDVVFEYRVRPDSMIRSLSKEDKEANISFIREKHYKLYCQNYRELYQLYYDLSNKMKRKRYKVIDSFIEKLKW